MLTGNTSSFWNQLSAISKAEICKICSVMVVTKPVVHSVIKYLNFCQQFIKFYKKMGKLSQQIKDGHFFIFKLKSYTYYTKSINGK